MLQTLEHREVTEISEKARMLRAKGFEALDAKLFELAKTYFEEFLALEPENPHAHIAMGGYYHKQSYFTEAEAYYRKVLELKPDSVGAFRNLGVLYRDQGALEVSLDYANKAFALDPLRTDILEDIAQTHEELHHYEQAEILYREVLAASPEHLESKVGMARCFWAQDRRQDAFSILLEMEQAFPETALPYEVFHVLGRLYHHQGHAENSPVLLQKAIDYYEKYISLDPAFSAKYRKDFDINVLNNLFNIYMHLEKESEAERIYSNMLDLDPENAYVKIKQARQLLDTNKCEEALQIMTALQGTVPEEQLPDHFFFWMGRIYDDLWQRPADVLYLEKAAYYYEKYTLLKPNEYCGYSQLANVQRALDNNLLSAKAWEKALSIDSRDFRDWIYLGKIYRDLKEYDKALEALFQANQIQESHLAHFHLCWTFYYQNQFPKTIEHAKQAIALYDKEPAYYQMLSLVYIQEAKLDESISFIEKALERTEHSDVFFPGNFRIIGKLFEEKGLIELAQRCYDANSYIEKKHHYNEEEPSVSE